MARRRHKSRETALLTLYASEYGDRPLHEVVDELIGAGEVSRKNWTAFAQELARRTKTASEQLDEHIGKALRNWRLERISKLDHMILRLALCEMQTFADIPVRVTLNEYIELAKQYGTEESSSFVNGILDRLAREHGKDAPSEPNPEADTEE